MCFLIEAPAFLHSIPGGVVVRYITGKGLHSAGGTARIKPEVSWGCLGWVDGWIMGDLNMHAGQLGRSWKRHNRSWCVK